MKTLTANFLRKHLEKGDPQDSRPEQTYYRFTNVKDVHGSLLLDHDFKENKVLYNSSLKKGVEYRLIVDKMDVIISISWGDGKEGVYKKNNNSIWRVAKDGTETNLSLNSPSQYFRQLFNAQKKEQKKKQ